MEFCNKDAYLWSVLPLTGTAGFPYVVSPPDTLPLKKRSKLYGIPYNGVYNSNLRLLTFITSPEGPISLGQNNELNNGIFLYLFSMAAVYTVKWKLPSKAKIGFYTGDYIPNLADTTNTKYYLMPTNLGIGIFDGCHGQFQFTGNGFFCVVVDKSLPVELDVSYEIVPIHQNIPTKLYTPVILAKWQCEVIMEQMNIGNVKVLNYPKPKYVDDALAKIQYLSDTVVTITTTPEAITKVTNKSLLKQTLKQTLKQPVADDENETLEGVGTTIRRNGPPVFFDVDTKNIRPQDRRTYHYDSMQYLGINLLSFPEKPTSIEVSFSVVTFTELKTTAVNPFVGKLGVVCVLPEQNPDPISEEQIIDVPFNYTNTPNVTQLFFTLLPNANCFGIRLSTKDSFDYNTYINNGWMKYEINIVTVSINYVVN